ncbi:MAG: hypothetical protein JO307_07770 [Bryobacterales bacterium]|nr:hypothetical protein [Bryobacterales bacterium]MBV9402045.1 hypothetical protein [Bryobacterales bacterium]
MHVRALSPAIVITALAANAQWLHYPTPGIPRLPNGMPNFTAPAPRTSDGKPDLSGIWGWEDNRACPPEGCADQKIGQEFINIGWRLKGGLPYQPWAAELVKKRRAENSKDDPQSRCLPRGAVRMLTDATLKKIVQVPGEVVIISERNATFRQIFTDNRPLPADPNPAWNGYSSGHWEGDALIVQTTGFRDDSWLDSGGSPLTEAGKVTEKFRRTDFGHLEIEITVDDPKAYTAPWTITLHQPVIVDTELLDYICSENERDSRHFK